MAIFIIHISNLAFVMSRGICISITIIVVQNPLTNIGDQEEILWVGRWTKWNGNQTNTKSDRLIGYLLLRQMLHWINQMDSLVAVSEEILLGAVLSQFFTYWFQIPLRSFFPMNNLVPIERSATPDICNCFHHPNLRSCIY